MDKSFGEVIEFLAKEASEVRSLLGKPLCQIPVMKNGKSGFFDISGYLYKLEKAITVLSNATCEERQKNEVTE